MKNPDHEELWHDAIKDAAPEAFVEATLALTLARARRVRRTRRVMRMAAGASAALVVIWVGVGPFRSTPTMAPSVSAPPVLAQQTTNGPVPLVSDKIASDRAPSIKAKVARDENTGAIAAEAAKPKGVPVRYLTDEELLDRFSGQPVGLAGSGASREFLVLANLHRDE